MSPQDQMQGKVQQVLHVQDPSTPAIEIRATNRPNKKTKKKQSDYQSLCFFYVLEEKVLALDQHLHWILKK